MREMMTLSTFEEAAAERIERIEKMEKNLDDAVTAVTQLRRALEEYESARGKISELYAYYRGDWMSDYEADAKGLLPRDLKRGVLSEDAVFDLMSDERELLEEMKNIAESVMKDLP